MDWARSCTAVIPCLNEAANLAPVIQGVRRHLPHVLVIDDGSCDATAAVAAAAGARVLTHPRTLGKGAALRTGLQAAATAGFDWVITLDGDGQHDPDDLPPLLQVASAGDLDLVIGNRMHEADSMPRLRRWVNRWMSRRISRRLGRSCPDSQCGLRLVRVSTWSRLALKADHFEAESEWLTAFAAGGARIGFVPIRCLRSMRPSRIRVVPDTFRWLRWWWRSSAAPASFSLSRREGSTEGPRAEHE